MEWVETTGRTVIEAKEFALDQLGVDEGDAEFEIVSEAKSGLFGRLKAQARVRARVRPTAPRSKESTSRRPKRQKSGDSSTQSEASSGAAPNEGRQRKSRPKSRSRATTTTINEGASEMDEQVPLQEQGDIAKEFLAGLLNSTDSAVKIDISTDEEEELIHIAIEGENLGHLIGPRGSTLHSLQEVTRTVVQRKTGARNGRILVDISQYREKRREALARFSRQVAEEVLSTGERRVLEPMNAGDRKVVHDVINTIDGVVTTSEGEEPRRRVVIKPTTSV